MSDVDAIQSKSVNEDSQSFRSAKRRPSLLIKNLLTLDDDIDHFPADQYFATSCFLSANLLYKFNKL